jgi:Transferase family
VLQINPITSISDLKKLTRRVFTVDLATIQLLKQQAIKEMTAKIPSPPTTFQVLAAHTWISIARARGITSTNDKPTFMLCFIDGRTLLPSPMDLSYTGNCLFPCIVHSTGSTLMSANGFGQTCGTVAETVRVNKSEVMGRNGQEQLTLNLASLSGLKVAFIGSNRLHFYGTDFGWGIPGLEALVSMNGDGDVVMTAGKEKGSVQITVALKEDMDAFTHAFEGRLASLKSQSWHQSSIQLNLA